MDFSLNQEVVTKMTKMTVVFIDNLLHYLYLYMYKNLQAWSMLYVIFCRKLICSTDVAVKV